MKKILGLTYLLCLFILYKIIREQKWGKKKRKYYGYSVGIIIIVSFAINSVPYILITYDGSKENFTLYDKLKIIYQISTYLLNPFTIIFSLLIVGFLNSKIDKLDYPNKFERSIWSIYNCGMNAIEKLELAFNLDNNHIIILVDNTKVSNYIKEKIDYINNLPRNKKIKVGIFTAMGTKDMYSVEALFVNSINEIKRDTEFIMKTYMKYLNDKIYKNISQLNTDVSLYLFKPEMKLKAYDTKIMSDYLANIIVKLNNLNEEWYKYYKPEIDKYRKKNNLNIWRVIDNESIRKRRIGRGLLIEEICNNIEKFSISNHEIKKEILYRLIENEKIYPNKEDAEKISKQLGVELEEIFVECNT